jgi:hypothetical protein
VAFGTRSAWSSRGGLFEAGVLQVVEAPASRQPAIRPRKRHKLHAFCDPIKGCCDDLSRLRDERSVDRHDSDGERDEVSRVRHEISKSRDERRRNVTKGGESVANCRENVTKCGENVAKDRENVTK